MAERGRLDDQGETDMSTPRSSSATLKDGLLLKPRSAMNVIDDDHKVGRYFDCGSLARSTTLWPCFGLLFSQ